MKNKLGLFLLSFLIALNVSAQNDLLSKRITPLKKYDSEHLLRVALPLGGIGTGTVSLGGSGQLQDWEVMNVPVTTLLFLPFIPGQKAINPIQKHYSDLFIMPIASTTKVAQSTIMVFHDSGRLHSKLLILSEL